MSTTVIPNNSNLQLATPLWDMENENVIAGLDLKPIVGWVCENLRKKGKSAIGAPVILTTPLTAFGTPHSDMWAIYDPETGRWDTDDRGSTGLDMLEKFFSEG